MEEKTTNNNRTVIIAVAATVIIGCCCVMVGIAGYYSFITIRSVETSTLQPSEIMPPATEAGIGEPPSGGLGNEVLRNDTWQVMAPAAVGLGCG